MRHSTLRGCAALAAAGALIAACSEVTGPTRGGQTLGALQLERSLRVAAAETRPDSSVTWSRPPEDDHVLTPPRIIDAPDTVRAGEPFRVTVHTIGENGCWRADGQELAVEGNVAAIVPWDAHSGADACTEVLGYLPHAVDVTFAERGTGIIRVTGSRRRQGDRSYGVEVTAERTVVVR